MADYRTMKGAEQLQKNKTQSVFCGDLISPESAPPTGESVKMSDLSMTMS